MACKRHRHYSHRVVSDAHIVGGRHCIPAMEVAVDGAPGAPNSKLYRVHLGDDYVMRTIPLAGWTRHEAITQDGRYVISTHPTRREVIVVDLQPNQVLKTIRRER